MDLRTGTCPLCQTSAVHVIDGGALTGANRIPMSAWRTAILNRYICTHCGYTQEYMEDPEDLQKVATKWPRVVPPTERPSPYSRATVGLGEDLVLNHATPWN